MLLALGANILEQSTEKLQLEHQKKFPNRSVTPKTNHEK